MGHRKAVRSLDELEAKAARLAAALLRVGISLEAIPLEDPDGENGELERATADVRLVAQQIVGFGDAASTLLESWALSVPAAVESAPRGADAGSWEPGVPAPAGSDYSAWEPGLRALGGSISEAAEQLRKRLTPLVSDLGRVVVRFEQEGRPDLVAILGDVADRLGNIEALAVGIAGMSRPLVDVASSQNPGGIPFEPTAFDVAAGIRFVRDAAGAMFSYMAAGRDSSVRTVDDGEVARHCLEYLAAFWRLRAIMHRANGVVLDEGQALEEGSEHEGTELGFPPNGNAGGFWTSRRAGAGVADPHDSANSAEDDFEAEQAKSARAMARAGGPGGRRDDLTGEA